jgi:glycosyltransferase involved in cell wall biosynthesis
MNIVIAAVSVSAQLSGVSRHAANVARCLLTRPDVAAVHLLVAPWQVESFREAISRSDARLHLHSVHIQPGTLARNLWYYMDLPAIASQLEADVVHLSYPMPVRREAFHCPTVVTLHDLYPYDIPENFGFPKVIFNRLVLWQCLRSADAIACVSDSTLRQLGMKAGRPLVEKAVRIYNSVESSSSLGLRNPMPQWNGEPFFFCVAQHRRNKNLLLTLRVFARLLHEKKIHPTTLLVIVGIDGPETPKIQHLIRTSGLSERVVLLSGIRDTEMQWCYKHCQLLLAPSIVEGFGLPVAEGLLAGSRIVCSDIPAFRELGGEDGCTYVPLTSSAEELFMDAICTVLAENRRKPSTLPQLSAPLIAAEYMRLYRQILGTRTSSSRQRHLSSRTAVQKSHLS